MILRKDCDRINLPPLHQICEIVVERPNEEGNIRYLADEVSYEHLLKLRKQGAKGRPCYFAMLDFGRKIEVYPTPDQDYVVLIRYLPPMQEI